MKKAVMLTILFASMLLSACTGVSTQEQLSESMAKVYDKEKGYRISQKELAGLEEKEQSTFNDLMKLTREQKEEVAAKAEELKSSLIERMDLIEKENESIHEAHDSISSMESLIENEEDGKLKDSLSELKEAFEYRYAEHEIVYEEYQKLSSLQEKLYDSLTNEKTDQEQLKKMVESVNIQNEAVQSAVNSFNEATKKVNELKNKVYDSLKEEK